MKKNTPFISFSLFFCLFFALQNAFAQKNDEKKIAQQLCDCVEKSFAKFPPVLREMIFDSAELGEEKAEIKFKEKLQKMTTKQQEELNNKMASLPNIEQEMDKNCANVSKYIKSAEQKNELLPEKLLALMKKNKKCKLGYAVMKMGFEKSKK